MNASGHASRPGMGDDQPARPKRCSSSRPAGRPAIPTIRPEAVHAAGTQPNPGFKAGPVGFPANLYRRWRWSPGPCYNHPITLRVMSPHPQCPVRPQPKRACRTSGNQSWPNPGSCPTRPGRPGWFRGHCPTGRIGCLPQAHSEPSRLIASECDPLVATPIQSWSVPICPGSVTRSFSGAIRAAPAPQGSVPLQTKAARNSHPTTCTQSWPPPTGVRALRPRSAAPI